MDKRHKIFQLAHKNVITIKKLRRNVELQYKIDKVQTLDELSEQEV